jgi:hypothetical protein
MSGSPQGIHREQMMALAAKRYGRANTASRLG